MRRPKTRRGFFPLFSVILIMACVLYLFLCFAFLLSDAKASVSMPTEEKIGIESLLRKQTLSEEDYALLYRQTGLTKIGIDRARTRGEGGIVGILSVQACRFTEYEVEHDVFAPLMCTDYLADGKRAVVGFLEDGDILITSSTHFSAFRMGHAGIVTDAERGEVLQATAYGQTSRIGTVGDFTNRMNFMILRPKADAATRKAVASYARENLHEIPYHAFAGIFTDKNTIAVGTQCAHLVWYAYAAAAGIDLCDHALVLPYDLATSDKAEVVQVFGFDQKTLWSTPFS